MSKNQKRSKTRRSGRGSSNKIDLRNDTFIIPRAPSIMPPTLSKTLRMSFPVTSVSSGPVNPISFYGNSIAYCGPQFAWSGGFNNSVPTGAAWFFSTNIGTGSVAPYGQYFVRSSRIMVTNISASAGAIGGYCTVFPSTLSSLSGMSQASLMEQPYAVSYDLQAYAGSGNALTPTVNNKMTTQQIFGYKYASTLEANPGLNGVPTVGSGVPTQPWFWHIVLMSANATSSIVQYCMVTIDYDIEFHSLNVPDVSTISLARPLVVNQTEPLPVVDEDAVLVDAFKSLVSKRK
jgi:hypothetical protein